MSAASEENLKQNYIVAKPQHIGVYAQRCNHFFPKRRQYEMSELQILRLIAPPAEEKKFT